MFDLTTRDIKYLSGVGPQRASVLNKELGIFSFHDLLYYFPYKYVDRSRIYYIQEIVFVYLLIHKITPTIKH